MKNAPGNDDVTILFPEWYGELRRIAGQIMKSERAGHTLSPTALVHEAYLRLAATDQMKFGGKTHFVSVAARCMRRILVDHARGHRAKKRGGSALTVTFNDETHALQVDSSGLLELDACLDELQKMSPRQATIIELWFFGGMTHADISEDLGISVPTIRRDWRQARAWLAARLHSTDQAPEGRA